MAKLGPYSYPDIRFGDAVEIAGRILTKFKGTVSVKGLAWEMGMAEGSGTLFAKVAALRDFGLVEGRGELRVTPLAQRVLHPADSAEAFQARAEAFQRVELLRRLYNRFQGEVPDDPGLLIGLEEVTRAPRDEIVRRASLIQKHLNDAFRALRRLNRKDLVEEDVSIEYSGKYQGNLFDAPLSGPAGRFPPSQGAVPAQRGGLVLSAGGLQLSAPLTSEYIDAAIRLLTTLKAQLPAGGETQADATSEAGQGDDLFESDDSSVEDSASGDPPYTSSFKRRRS